MFKRKIKSVAIVSVTAERKLGFSVPAQEKVKLFSYNTTKKALEKEWKKEGLQAVAKMLPNQNVLSIDKVEFARLDGKELI